LSPMESGRLPSGPSMSPLVRFASAALVVPAFVVLVAGVALAQARTRRAAGTGDAGAFGARAGASPATPAPANAPSGSASLDAGVAFAATLDGGTHVFKFTELDIEGRLKTPQLVYFLRRVRAEFAAGDLGHRSFFREMSESRKESSF
jgi:hypothetical protein